MKDQLRESLNAQVAQQKAQSEASKKHEMEADQMFLRTAAETQNIEDFALAKKNQAVK